MTEVANSTPRHYTLLLPAEGVDLLVRAFGESARVSIRHMSPEDLDREVVRAIKVLRDSVALLQVCCVGDVVNWRALRKV